jgi:PAS domain S-box-containing protein
LGQALVKLVWAVGSEIPRGWKFLMVLRSQGQAFRIEESSTLGLGLAVFRAASLGFPPETLALDGVEGPYEGPGPDGLPSLAYHRQVRLDVGIGMGLVLLTSLDVAEHEVFNDLRRQIILWLVLLSGVIGLGIVVAARISMPVKELASTAKQIATGDLSARAMVNQRSELGQFAQVFNRMADQLRDWSAGLERQVEERTRDLRLLSLRQEAILSAVPDIIMEVDTNKVYTWANPAGYVFFGPDVIGREAASYFVGEQDTYVVVRPLFDGNSPPIYVESWQRRRDGEARLLAWWCKSLTGDGGEVIGTLSTARDITEERRAAEKIRQALREKETLIQEVYHRTKNTLQVIQGILELQAAEHPGQGEFQALVRDTSLRIQAIALVHQMLYRSSDLSRVSATVYLKELSGLILGMAGKAETPVDLEISQEDHFMTLDTVIPLGLILNELMTNSLKYAFEAGRRGWISIGLEGNGDHGYRFNYSDDGRGLPEGFDCRFQGGLGMRLIYGLAEEQLGGKVAIAGQDGFRFQFEFVPLDAGPRV